jgi:hypothetical protein
MQTGRSSDSSSKKSVAKPRPRKAAKTETLHLKSQQLVATLPLDLNGMIATAAYYCAEQRHFEPGHELEDWLTAEQTIRALHR